MPLGNGPLGARPLGGYKPPSAGLLYINGYTLSAFRGAVSSPFGRLPILAASTSKGIGCTSTGSYALAMGSRSAGKSSALGAGTFSMKIVANTIGMGHAVAATIGSLPIVGRAITQLRARMGPGGYALAMASRAAGKSSAVSAGTFSMKIVASTIAMGHAVAATIGSLPIAGRAITQLRARMGPGGYAMALHALSISRGSLQALPRNTMFLLGRTIGSLSAKCWDYGRVYITGVTPSRGHGSGKTIGTVRLAASAAASAFGVTGFFSTFLRAISFGGSTGISAVRAFFTGAESAKIIQRPVERNVLTITPVVTTIIVPPAHPGEPIPPAEAEMDVVKP